MYWPTYGRLPIGVGSLNYRSVWAEGYINLSVWASNLVILEAISFHFSSVEPIARKNDVNPSQSWRFLKSFFVAEKWSCKAYRSVSILKFLCFCWHRTKHLTANFFFDRHNECFSVICEVLSKFSLVLKRSDGDWKNAHQLSNHWTCTFNIHQCNLARVLHFGAFINKLKLPFIENVAV